MNAKQLIEKIKGRGSEKDREGMVRYGINTGKAFGVSIYKLRPIAKEIGKNHVLAKELWDSGVHEAQLLAGMTDNPDEVTEKQMESWVEEINSWDLCDQTCSNLFCWTRHAYKKVYEWSARKEEFVKRSAFALMAALTFYDKKTSDSELEKFLPVIKRESTDGRNYVKKAVNWALRNIGKRNPELNKKAVKTAREIEKIGDKTARWIAKDALREITGSKLKERLMRRERKKVT